MPFVWFVVRDENGLTSPRGNSPVCDWSAPHAPHRSHRSHPPSARFLLQEKALISGSTAKFGYIRATGVRMLNTGPSRWSLPRILFRSLILSQGYSPASSLASIRSRQCCAGPNSPRPWVRLEAAQLDTFPASSIICPPGPVLCSPHVPGGSSAVPQELTPLSSELDFVIATSSRAPLLQSAAALRRICM